MKLIFISDLHLTPTTIAKNQLFYNLLQTWALKIDALYILGDFFDYWLGDDDDNEFIREMKHNLQQFTKTTPTYFLGGNHDFLVGRKFARKTGIQLIKDLSTIKLANHTILLSHGDTFCTLDVGYQKMKKILQNPIVIFILLRSSLKFRYKIKEKLENEAQTQTNTQPAHNYHVVDSTIIKLATKYNADIVIHGHTHNPGHYIIATNAGKIERYEIPDWEDNTPGGYLEVTPAKISVIMQ